MRVTIHLLDSAPMTNPPAAARVLSWLSWPKAPPGSTAYSDQGRPMARRSASREGPWRPVALRDLDLAWSTLQEWLEPHRREAGVRNVRSYAQQRLVTVRG